MSSAGRVPVSFMPGQLPDPSQGLSGQSVRWTDVGVDAQMSQQAQNEGGEALAGPEVVGADSRVRRTCWERVWTRGASGRFLKLWKELES